MGFARPMPEYDPSTEEHQIDPTTTCMASLVVDLPRGKLMKRTRNQLLEGINPSKHLRRADAPVLASPLDDETSSMGTPTQTSATSQAFSDVPSNAESNTNTNAGEDSDNPLEEDHDNTIDPSLRQKQDQDQEEEDEYADLNNIQSSANNPQMRWDHNKGIATVDEATINIERPAVCTFFK